MKVSRRSVVIGASGAVLAGCSGGGGTAIAVDAAPDAGVTFEPFEPEFSALVDKEAVPRLLSTGHQWSEGPAWDHIRQKLYFTDVPKNRAYSWSPAEGVEIFLDPSGIDPESAVGMREIGANGLLLSQTGELLVCNHGARSMQALDFHTGERRILADKFDGKRFNSPNDVIETSGGLPIFTDPPYGLEGLNEASIKEQETNGVYCLTRSGKVVRLLDDMTFPNGIVLSPDEKYLYISQSDPEAPLIRRYSIARDRGDQVTLSVPHGEEVWFDAKPYMHEVGGLPDGMAVSAQGDIFLAGPGGVLVIGSAGKCLGRIATGRPTANCAFGEDGQTLFITAADRLLAVRTKTTGLGRF